MAGPADAEDMSWDEGNETHLAARCITLADVQSVLFSPVARVPNKERSGRWWATTGEAGC